MIELVGGFLLAVLVGGLLGRVMPGSKGAPVDEGSELPANCRILDGNDYAYSEDESLKMFNPEYRALRPELFPFDEDN